MTQLVEVPLWGLVALAAFAGFWLLDRALIPSVRWALRRRANRAIARLNQRLQVKIPPFKLARRRVLIEQILNDADVVDSIGAYARAEDIPQEIALAKARTYAREIVPSFSAYAYFGFGTRISRWLSMLLYRVRLGASDDAALKAIPSDTSVVFMINHRSNMDYVLVTYMAAQSSALSYAVGEWAHIFGLRALLRAMGAFFIRRNSRNALYRKVLSRYVAMATRGGVTQAVFPEGGLTRDGCLRAPKIGLLSYMVSDFDPSGARDIVFVPVGINYDRVLEDRVLTEGASHEADGTPPRFAFSLTALLRYCASGVWRMLNGRWYRNGYTCVSFGAPRSLKAWLAARDVDFRALEDAPRRAEMDALAEQIMADIGAIVPVLPVALVASALQHTETDGVTAFELKGRIFRLIDELEHAGAHIHIPRHDLDYAIDVGLRMLTLRGIVTADDGLIAPNPEEQKLLSYYANSIAHLMGGGDGAAGEN
ncbi:MAG: 1-acyl-sn-glycerol-3-phosphate acyltransferase [Pseudomonadota bacterium]